MRIRPLLLFFGTLCLVLPLWVTCASRPPQPPDLSSAGEGRALDGGRPSPRATVQPLSARVMKMGRSYRTYMDGAQRVKRGDHVDILATAVDRKKGQRVTVTLLQNLIVLDHSPPGQVAVLVLPEEAELLALSTAIAPLVVVRRNPEDLDVYEERKPLAYEQLLDLRLEAKHRKARLSRFQKDLERIGSRGMATGPVKGSRELCLPLAGAAGVLAGDQIDVLATLRDAMTRDWISFLLLVRVVVSAQPRPDGCVPVLVTSEECERAVQALRLGASEGTLSASLRRPGDKTHQYNMRPATRSTLIHGEKRGCPHPDRHQTIKRIKIIRGLPGLKPDPRPAPRARPLSPPRPRP